MTLGQCLMSAQARIAAVSDSPRLDAELLLGQVLGLSRARIFAQLHDELPPAQAQHFEALVARRAAGEPVAYLVGTRGFWTFDLAVTPAVLVPRPETELLVEWGLELLRGVAQPRIVDLGTGSGALALALASERADAQVDATDLSVEALAVARANADRLGRSVCFRHGDWFGALGGRRYDLIVSNPPYIAHDDPHLAILRHEPLAALTDGGDGLGALRAISAGAARHLADDGWLLVEHGYDQGAAVRALFSRAGFVDVSTRRDYAGQERATAGRSTQR
ncbi:peptide chain release factor N(5)-glutamine methyltransferase [Fontimonas sp. SYSU GA230001]|uniref:peptide chain release factor N(5)-glutamine methyltransferase n=1 Tax=Fontimonas sp. SYSU GA230001 TaxID=3142450 RepID=UPI0032B462B4